ncbi:elongation of very long chain fatty acids protein 6-like isoform X2 [Centruroides sculpturatus]|nr:elongation of very long chain fatty acids protein 6-like isoform X2 [Centruroides sculpturatus]
MELNFQRPAYVEPFEFEKLIVRAQVTKWMANNWHHSLYWSALYLVVVFGGKHLMKSRPAYKLKRPLAVWNISLAIFSLIGTIRLLPGFYHVLRDRGFTFSVCNISYIGGIESSFFWGWLFILSKVLEFGDTIFIVLRKQKLIFLHWYHHIVTLVFTWYNSGNLVSLGHWFIFMNFTVHSLMYGYFALKALNIKIPRPIAMMITLCQISQMFIGVFLCSWAYKSLASGTPCEITYTALNLNSFMYFTYVVLFCYFFYNSYIVSGKKVQGKKAN